ncbi:hypothetical protein LJR231_000512 [Phyllobacterium sp. LjRoot231]|uniref:hypothetical protein n=1 Tax=Phyllobacterium sp. LjRoot231 TaxID=3342289 RepID=UPI003ECE131F
MASYRTLLAALLGCLLLAGCNGSDNTADTGDTSGTFAECQTGTLVDGKCVITPTVTTKECPAGSLLVGGECVVTRNVVPGECPTGSTLDGSQCVATRAVVIKCERGILVDGECIDIRVPPATDRVNRDDGMKSLTWNGNEAKITTADSVSVLRNYQLTTTQEQRKSGKSKQLEIKELADAPTIRTGSQMFDGLFAMAVQESRDLTKTSISDGKYKQGAAIPCGGTVGCFQTGDSWTYVWTRDTAYAVDLGQSEFAR